MLDLSLSISMLVVLSARWLENFSTGSESVFYFLLSHNVVTMKVTYADPLPSLLDCTATIASILICICMILPTRNFAS